MRKIAHCCQVIPRLREYFSFTELTFAAVGSLPVEKPECIVFENETWLDTTSRICYTVAINHNQEEELCKKS